MTRQKKDSILWRITPTEDGPVSYLFGTMHVRDLRAFTWFEQACRHMDACEIFAVEFDFGQVDPTSMAQAFTLPRGLQLQQLLSKNAWQNLTFHCRKRLGLPPEAFQTTHPMQVQVALTRALLANDAGYSLDEMLWEYARYQGKILTGLETFEEQILLMRSIRMEDHVKSLTWLLKHFGRQKERLKKMMRWYQEGRIQELYQAARRDARHLRRPLLLVRNERMAQRFADLARQRSLFCAVGAAHLGGGKGMLRLLKRAGFTVKPVPYRAQ